MYRLSEQAALQIHAARSVQIRALEIILKRLQELNMNSDLAHNANKSNNV